jgi:hypothetical protein
VYQLHSVIEKIVQANNHLGKTLKNLPPQPLPKQPAEPKNKMSAECSFYISNAYNPQHYLLLSWYFSVSHPFPPLEREQNLPSASVPISL